MNFLEGGISFPGRNLYGKFNITETDIAKNIYDGELFFQWTNHEKLHSTFKILQSGSFTGYVFSSLTNITNMNPIELSGSLKLEATRKSSFLDLSFDGTEIDQNVKHSGKISLFSNETEKLVYVNIKSKQDIFLQLNLNRNPKSLKVELMWDKENDPDKRIYFHFTSQPDCYIELVILDFDAKLIISSEKSSIFFGISFDEKKMEFESRLKLDFDALEILFSFKTTFLSTSNVKIHLQCSQHYEDRAKNITLQVC